MPPRSVSRAIVSAVTLSAAAMTTLGTVAPALAQSGGPPVAAVVVKDTSYPIPPTAKFVATTGNDAYDGTQATPWRTIQKAVNSTPTGGTVVVRGGTYRESVALSNKTLTVQAYPHEQVWLKGSLVVTGWTVDGSTWRKDAWTYSFPHLTTASGYIDPNFPLAGYPDMVYLDGAPLTQVASKALVVGGTFFVDDANHQLYVGSDPTGHTVEAAAYQNVLVLYNAPNSQILGLGFAHAASKADSAGSAVIVNTSNGVLLENDTFAWNAASGMEVGQLSNDVVVRGNELVNNGLVGATSWGSPQRLVFQGNHVASNNQERFSVYWAAAGVKLNGVVASTVSDNVAENNWGTGIWCDNGCSNVNVVRNISRNNAYQGFMYEISDGAVIASNIAANNATLGGGGVYVSESTNVKVYNNTIVNNAVANARSVDVNSNSRKTTSGVVVQNNIYSHSISSGLWLTRVQDDLNAIPAANMASTDSNAYYRQSSGSGTIEVRWGKAGGYDDFATLGAFQAATGQELHGLGIDGGTNPFFVNEAAGDYHLRTGSVAVGRGAALPQDVADAVGVSAGSPVDLGILRWPGSTADTTPPTAPSGLSATAAGTSQINLAWTASTDNVGVTGYRVYRDGGLAGSPTGATYSDTGLASGTTYSYYVVATDAAGLTSAASNTASAATSSPSVDTTPPVITKLLPADGTVVAKSVTVSAAATDNVGVKRMEILIDGALRASSATATIGYVWNSRSASPGTHTITVKAYDAANNSATKSATVSK